MRAAHRGLRALLALAAYAAALIAVLAHAPARAAAVPLELEIDLDPGTRRLHAVAQVTPASRDFRFALHESLEISAVTAGGKPLPALPAGRDGAVRGWRIALPANVDSVRIEYGGTLPALQRERDHRGVLQGLPPMASNEGSFLPAGGAWYPQPAALFAYRVTVAVPAGQRALVAGRLLDEDAPAGDAGTYRARFEFAQPADGIDLMAGPYIIRERMMPRAGAGAVRLRTYFFRDLDAMPGLADAYLADTQRYLDLYSAQIGAYPFSEFSVVASPLPTGFGMPALTYLGADVLKLPFIRATSLGHEVLHNWWGNGVYVDYAKGNWAEGLTTFMADYAYKERESADAARQMRLGWLRDFAAVPAGSQQPLVSFRTRTHGAAAAVGYGKSAMLFVMLRDTVGEDAFARGIRSFWESRQFRLASWSDLQQAFEKACGCALDTFFNQWLNREGAPAISIASATARPDAGKTHVTLALRQATPPYALRLPVEIVYPGRTEVRWIDVRRQSEDITLMTDAQPDGVRVDPELHVWRVLAPEQLPPILRQWIIARAPRLLVASPAADVREAAQTLAQRLFEAPARSISANELGRGTEPVLLAGLHADVDAALAAAGLPARPSNLTHGSAQVWTVTRGAGPPVAVVSARDADALRALLRPLPHYGAQSWLVFDGSRVLERGVWPAPGPLIPVRAAQ